MIMTVFSKNEAETEAAGAAFGMSPVMFAPVNPEAYFNGLLGVSIIPYRLQR